jgi:hypothetical protein
MTEHPSDVFQRLIADYEERKETRELLERVGARSKPPKDAVVGDIYINELELDAYIAVSNGEGGIRWIRATSYDRDRKPFWPTDI